MEHVDEVRKSMDEWNEKYHADHAPLADIVITRNRNGYIYRHAGKLLNDGSTMPTRPPRVASLMASFLKFGPGQPFTIKEAVDANYDAGRQAPSMKYHGHWATYSPEQLKDDVTRDWWVRVNVADNLQGAHKYTLEIILRDSTITVQRIARGTYRFHLVMNSVENPDLVYLAEFMNRYHNQFEQGRPK